MGVECHSAFVPPWLWVAKVPREAALSAGFEADFFVTFAGVGARTQCARRRTGGTDQGCRGPGPQLIAFPSNFTHSM